MGESVKILKLHFWPEEYINISPQYTKRCGIATFGGVCFLRKKDFVNIFMRKSGVLIFEITIELYCNLKNQKSRFSHDNIDKIHFLKKTYPPKCCYSASFGILWTNIDIFFWPKMQFQNVH